MGAKLSEIWKQQIVVENRTGGGGTVAADHVAKSPADGYTYLFATVSDFCITPHTYSRLAYDIRRDFTPVLIATETPIMLAAHSGAPFSSPVCERQFINKAAVEVVAYLKWRGSMIRTQVVAVLRARLSGHAGVGKGSVRSVSEVRLEG